MSSLIPTSFYARDTRIVARELLGKGLRHGGVLLRITETEAYCPDDTANHCRAGRTVRNAAMWGPPGRAYVYLCYGLHQMLNLVTEADGVGAAVLIRACEPLEGLEVIGERRGGRSGPALLTGPGKVGQALALDRSWCHHPLDEPGGLEVLDAPAPEGVLVGPRIGIGYASAEHGAAPWRFAVAGSPWVSHRKGLVALR